MARMDLTSSAFCNALIRLMSTRFDSGMPLRKSCTCWSSTAFIMNLNPVMARSSMSGSARLRNLISLSRAMVDRRQMPVLDGESPRQCENRHQAIAFEVNATVFSSRKRPKKLIGGLHLRAGAKAPQ